MTERLNINQLTPEELEALMKSPEVAGQVIGNRLRKPQGPKPEKPSQEQQKRKQKETHNHQVRNGGD